ncbi:unnamed protein product [Withania somnifera]
MDRISNDESEFSYGEKSENGPPNCGKIHQEWRTCNTGKLQSPIDLLNKRLRWESVAGYLKINGTQYQLQTIIYVYQQLECKFNLEAHFVHESNDGKTAVIGIIYKIGRPDSFLSMIEKDLKALASVKGVERAIRTIDPRKIKLDGKKYYRYIGSLTVPRCTEDVVWTINRKVKTATKRQMKLTRDAVHDESETNARPAQPLNKRPIKLYKPKEIEVN